MWKKVTIIIMSLCILFLMACSSGKDETGEKTQEKINGNEMQEKTEASGESESEEQIGRAHV